MTIQRAMKLILLFGLVSLFGDIIYEGARSVNGPYLKTLGASAAMVGLIAGLGEFIGYAVRLLSGYFTDRMRAHWFFTFLGYGMLAAVPLMALAGVWQMAALFIIAERLGKGLRGPARDTIVSQASKGMGTGIAFGITEALDQIGAVAGPLIFTGIFFFGGALKGLGDYQAGYGMMWLPFALLMLCVLFAYRSVPNPEELELAAAPQKKQPENLTRVFWIYTAFTFVATMGFVNFVLAGYHFKATGVLTDAQIPLFYAIAMGIDGAAALAIGKAYDSLQKRGHSDNGGLATLLVIPVLSLPIPFLIFSRSFAAIAVSVVLWGIVMAAHETIMRSAIADLTPLRKRGTGYGIFNTAYGVAAFAGSFAMGLLYERSLTALIIAAAALQLIALGIFFVLKRESERYASPRIESSN